MNVEGKVWRYGDNIDTDVIIPARYLNSFDPKDLAAHCMEDIDETFSKTVRKMFVQFAKTGNPSLTAELSPDGKAKVWPLYDLKDKQVMVLDEFNIHPEKESQRKIVDWERTYFLTKYFSF